ncbi:MAG TPA: DUF2795 domain-containing protein [Acidimicrobiales bacterium]|nr:DUF2795 domain-containing protein [Acidimicrobiales bacterium]
MPRGSDKHSPRIDDSLEHDTRPLTQGAPMEARADEGRQQEGAADDEPTTDALLTGDIHPGERQDALLDHDEAEARSRLAAHLRPSIWPADRETLLACAEEMHAPPDILDRLRQLPDGMFSHTEAVWEASGGRVESRP